MFKSLSHFEFIFVHSVRVCSSFIVVSIEISPFSFLTLFIWVLSLFLVSLARGFSVLFTLSNKLFLVSLIFLYCFLNLYFIDFLFDLYGFLPSADLGFSCSSFPNSFKWWVKLSI